MQNTRARYMSYVGTGKIPTLLDGKAEDVTPAYMPLVIPKHNRRRNRSTWARCGLAYSMQGKARTFESVTVAPAVVPDPKPQEKTEPKAEAETQPVPLAGSDTAA